MHELDIIGDTLSYSSRLHWYNLPLMILGFDNLREASFANGGYRSTCLPVGVAIDSGSDY